MLNFIARLFRRDPTCSPRHASQSRRRRRAPRPRLVVFEPLEGRMLLSVDLIGIPDWSEQGARPLISDANEINTIAAPGNAAGGAIESLAVRPIPSSSNFQIYAATVNGGVWRSDNADPANPGNITWTPLTDQMPSLATGSIAFSPLDTTGNTLFVGTGSFSSLSQSGGPAVGIMRTTNGGATWQNFALTGAGSNQVKTVVPTAVDLDAGAGVQEMVLVGTVGGGGLYRSNDNGQTYTLLSGANGLPGGDISQLIVDPNNTNRFYAGVPNQGIYRGDFDTTTGVITWAAFNTGLAGFASAGNIQITGQDDGGTTVLFALVSGSSRGAFRLDTTGGNTTWAALATPPEVFKRDVTVRAGNFIVADPTDSQIVYATTYSSGDHVYRYDPSGSGSWQVIMAGGGGPTRPHPDGRGLAFMGTNTLVEVNDGGIYFLPSASTATAGTNSWQSFNGNTSNETGIGAVEFHNIAWDSLFDVIAGGSQDNGTEVQVGTGDKIWTAFNGGDGGDMAIDDVTLAGAGRSIRYVSSQDMGGLSRVVFDSAANIVQDFGILPGGGLTGFTGTFVPHFEVNAVNPAAGQSKALVVGGSGASPVYIATMPAGATSSADVTWTAVSVAAGFGTVNTLAFGGRSGGADNADVLYAGTGSGLFVRSTAGGTLTATGTAFPGGGVSDVTLDPNDWQHIFVASASGVWESTNAGTNWTDRTGDFVGSNIQTIEFAEAGTVDTVLVGALGGVFRMVTNAPGVWSEYGQHLPNTVVYDLDYHYADDIVVAGTLGRGAWVVDNARDTLTVLGVLQIFGDEDYGGQDDTFKLISDADNPSLLNVWLNSDFYQFQFSTIQQINVNGLGGNDTLMVDSSFGLIDVLNGIRYDGGSGSDALELLQTGGPQRVSDTYSVGPANGQGLSTIVGGGAFGTQVVWFENLEPVLDIVPAATLTVNATAGDNAVNYSIGSLITQGLVSVDAHETIEFSNKAALVINSLAGADSIGINNANTPTSLTSIAVNGGDPAAGDALTITGAGVAVTVNTATAVITGATGAAGAVSMTYSGIESLALAGGIASLSFTTTAAADTLVVTPGASGAANSGTLTSSGAGPSISFVNSGALTADLDGGNDSVSVIGSSLADTIVVSGAAVAISGRNTVSYSNADSVAVDGGIGSDIFDVTPSALAVFIDGGDPVGSLPGDLLNIISGVQSVTYNAGPETDEGSFDVGANAPVSFDHIESLAISGTGSAVINATDGPDAITVVARSTLAGTDGVQDFTVSVNSGPQLLFVNVATLGVNAKGGSDEVTLIAPAPNNAAWDVDVTISGGPPAVGGDRLIVQTPVAGPETVVYTPSTADSGSLDLVAIVAAQSSAITFSEIESLSYDGQNDGDSLKVVATGAGDAIVHTPGVNDQAGSLLVNGLLPISYQSLGAAAALTVDGAGSIDLLVVNGTAANDTFSIDATGKVSLNNRLAIATANIEELTLEGLAGDDSFTLVPAVSASVYPTINLNGGSQASASGDRVYLVGTAGADSVAVGGQVVTMGGVTVSASGIENIRLDLLAGDDLLTYNGVVGVAENITVGSSGVVGGGQISVPNVTLVDFSGVERIVVNGNTTPTETDTLTFAGTNAVDRFRINLAAAGDTNDPVAKLQTSTNVTLLTLENYTGFDTLRVNGLDGSDTFNVYTSAGMISRNLFVDGGLPTGKKKSTDNLNVFYGTTRPRIIHSTATQDPDAGLIDLDYGTNRYLVQYDNVEQVTIQRGS